MAFHVICVFCAFEILRECCLCILIAFDLSNSTASINHVLELPHVPQYTRALY